MERHSEGARHVRTAMWEARWREAVTNSLPAHVATGDIPGTMIRAGDVVVLDATEGEDPGKWVRQGCVWQRLPCSELDALHRAMEATYAADYTAFFERPWALLPVMDGDWLLEYLADPDGEWLQEYIGLPVASGGGSRVIVVRPLRSPVSQPVEATTDDGALFELLAQVGGRMPSEGGR
ncbi:MAG: hypothetical protein AMXMBFR53_42790 [Gemmatimonadota bacterium]